VTEKTYPDAKPKNKIASLIYWFYNDFMGVQPDATSYSGGTKILGDLMKANKDMPGIRLYTANEVADLLYYLKEKGVRVDGLNIARTSGLLMAFVEKDNETLDRIVNYFLGETGGKGKKEEWRTVEGW